MHFRYKAKKQSGLDATGEREAPDKFTLARELRAEGLILVSVEPVIEKKFAGLSMEIGGRVTLKEKIIFANNVSSMITAGLTLSRALGIMERQTTNRYFKKILASIGEKVSKGESFNSSLAAFPKVFPAVFVAMVSAGEESGKLPQSLKIVADQLTKTYELRRKVRGAMIYPAIIISLIIAIAILMMIFLVPTLTMTFKDLGVELPLSTRIVIFISDFFNNHLLLLGFAAVALITGIVAMAKTTWGRRGMDWFVLHLPVIGTLAKQTNAAVTMRTIASLVTSGVSMVESLRITERVIQNSYYKEILHGAVDEVQKGLGLSAIFRRAEKLYPVLVGEMAEVGEETGNLAEMLTNGAVFYEEEVSQATKNLSTIIEPALMVLIGIAVGFFALSMIGPMYSLSEAL